MSEFVQNLGDVFAHFGSIRAKRMFGGYGIYRGDVMFGLVVDNELYLKADEQTIADFAQRSLAPFEYARRGKKIKLSYYTAPDVIFEDADAAKAWADRAYAAALRACQRKKR